MEDLEKQIEKAAIEEYKVLKTILEPNIYNMLKETYIHAAKSNVAKAYWQQNMYSEEEVQVLLCKFKDDHPLHRGIQIFDKDCIEWLNKNKKK